MTTPTIGNRVASAAALAGLALMTLSYAAGPAAAKANTAQSCTKKYHACQSRCEGRIPKGITQTKSAELLINCIKRTCNRQYDNCIASTNKPGGDGKRADTPADPLKPKGGDTRTPTTDGNKANPKSPPKVNDTRAPLGGGVFGSKTTSGSGSAGSGTILRSSPRTGGNTPTFRPVGSRR
jgi:hypothetical protein